MTIDEVPHTIIGVTPPEFFGLQVGRRVDVSVPLDGSEEPHFWKSRALVVRLAPGVSRATATADLNVAFQQYLAGDKTLSDRDRAQRFKALDLAPASSGLSEFRDRYGKQVQAMLAIVSVLLVLGCANLASLFLARAATRQRDLSVCLAFGASRTRLARQILSEILFISMAGGALGVLAASWGVDVLVGFLPDVGASTHLEIGADRNVLLFGLCATLLTGLCIGLAPALLARRVDIRHMLSAGGRTVGFGGGAFKTFIMVQVALSTVLVVAALLFGVTLSNLKTQSLGFVADGVLTLTVDADGTGIEGRAARRGSPPDAGEAPGSARSRARVVGHYSAAQLERGWETDLHPGRHLLVTRRPRVAGEYRGTGLLRNVRRAHCEGTRYHRVRSPVGTAGGCRQREHGAPLLPWQRSGRPAHGRGSGSLWRADRDCRRRRRCSI